MTDDTWQLRAACGDKDPQLFTIDKFNEKTAKVPKAICNTCNVSDKCLAFALKYSISGGIWGGLTPAERDALKRRNTISGQNSLSS